MRLACASLCHHGQLFTLNVRLQLLLQSFQAYHQIHDQSNLAGLLTYREDGYGAFWYVENDKARTLHALDLVRDGPFLYTELGVYGAEPHGTPCDVLPLRRP